MNLSILTQELRASIRTHLQEEETKLKARLSEIRETLRELEEPQTPVGVIIKTIEPVETTRVMRKQKESRKGLSDCIAKVLHETDHPLTVLEIAAKVMRHLRLGPKDRTELCSSISSILVQYLNKPTKKGFRFERTKENGKFIYTLHTESAVPQLNGHPVLN